MAEVLTITDLREQMRQDKLDAGGDMAASSWDVEVYVAEGFAGADDREFDSLVKESAKLVAEAEARHAAVLAEAQRRSSYRQTGFRSTATWVSHLTGLSKAQSGSRVKRASLLANKLTDIFDALLDGEITPDHVAKICSVATRFTEEAVRDQAHFLRWSTEPWPVFKRFVESWAELMDDTDPQELTDKAHMDRRMVWAQGVGHTTLVELSIPNECFEVLLVAMQPVFDKLLAAEWADARSRLGEDATFADLERTDRQRWLDSLLELIRTGAAASAGGAVDPGISAILNVVVDHATLQKELDRYAADAGSDDEDPPASADDAENYRCHTLSGLPVSPSLALRIAIAGSVRRFVMTANNLDFAATATTRLFKGAKRIGLVIRDQNCRGPGCDAPANRCEADHIRESSSGGLTLPGNGQMLCRPCHRAKTQLYTQGFAGRRPAAP